MQHKKKTTNLPLDNQEVFITPQKRMAMQIAAWCQRYEINKYSGSLLPLLNAM